MKQSFEIMPEEYWWGGCVHNGHRMPYSAGSKERIDLAAADNPNQAASLFLSSKGRVIYSDKPFVITFDNNIDVEGQNIRLLDGFVNLKGAYLAAAEKTMNFTGQIPDKVFFMKPQYNTWIELTHFQTQTGVLKYARDILNYGLVPGVLMIDAGWSEYFGSFDFNRRTFPTPKEMIDELHKMGFRVMLWISPNISPDSPTFRSLRDTGCLVRDKEGKIAVREWWDGYSAVLDLTGAEAIEWFSAQLDSLIKNFGVDGFKIDAADAYFYRADDNTQVRCLPQEQTAAVNCFGIKYQFNEFRCAWNMGGYPLVQRLCDKNHSWDTDGLKSLIPNSLAQGLLGYVYHCPDMIGGGEYINFGQNAKNLDMELFVRYAQVCALMPMMQFSAAPWRVLDEESFLCVKKAAKLHERFGEYILELAQNASNTGEPIVRHMAYEFPDEGMETEDEQFMLGDKILSAPVVRKNQKVKEVKLPKGKWKNDKGEIYDGGRTIREQTALDRIIWYQKLD